MLRIIGGFKLWGKRKGRIDYGTSRRRMKNLQISGFRKPLPSPRHSEIINTRLKSSLDNRLQMKKAPDTVRAGAFP